MSDTLRDQLLGLGFKAAPKPERKPEARRDGRAPNRQGQPPGKPGGGKPQAHAGKPGQARPAQGKPQRQGPHEPRSQEDIDLAKAYAIRAQREKDERIEAERLKQEEARLRREARAKLDELIKDKGLNVPDADIARHFPYGGKIKRIYVTAEQLKALNGVEGRPERADRGRPLRGPEVPGAGRSGLVGTPLTAMDTEKTGQWPVFFVVRAGRSGSVLRTRATLMMARRSATGAVLTAMWTWMSVGLPGSNTVRPW
jgi:uncharacterized protein YaiL (DUF2058 family)